MTDSNALVAQHLPLAEAVARRHASWAIHGYDLDDLISSAQVGLVKAAQTWDETRGVPFAVWAKLRIRAAMIDDLRAYVGSSTRQAHRRGETVERPGSLDMPAPEGGDTIGQQLVDEARSVEGTVEVLTALRAGAAACRDQLDRDILAALFSDRPMLQVARAAGLSHPSISERAARLRGFMRRAAA